MRGPRLMLVLLLCGVMLVPAALPVAADDKGDDDDDGGEGDGGNGRGNGNGHQRRGDDGKGDGDDDKDGGDENDDEDDGEKGDGDDGRHKGDRKGGDGRSGKGEGRADGDVGSEVPVAEDATASARRGAPMVEVEQDYAMAPGVMTYTFTVSNNGPREAQDVQLHGQVPDVATWALAEPGACLLDGTDVDCDVGDLAPGATRTVAVQGIVLDPLPSFLNVVQVYTPMGDDPAAPSSP